MDKLHEIKTYFDKQNDWNTLTEFEYVKWLIERAEKLEKYEKEVKGFVDKHFVGGSKSNREDYAQMVSTKDIFELRKLVMSDRMENLKSFMNGFENESTIDTNKMAKELRGKGE